MYKLLQELKKPSSCPSKKLKNVNGSLKLDISPCPVDEVKQCLTPDLIPLLSYDMACKIILLYYWLISWLIYIIIILVNYYSWG